MFTIFLSPEQIVKAFKVIGMGWASLEELPAVVIHQVQDLDNTPELNVFSFRGFYALLEFPVIIDVLAIVDHHLHFLGHYPPADNNFRVFGIYLVEILPIDYNLGIRRLNLD
jgi:hypothetical protein